MKRALSLAAVLAALTPALPAQAGDLETWDWVEVRVPLTDGQHGLPNSLRVFTDARFGTRYPNGLGQLFFRVGPIWDLHPNLFLGIHHTVYANQYDPAGQPGAFEVVQRPEIEPNVRWRWGDLTFNDRNRFEYAFSSRTSFFRYRNQLRVNYQPPGAVWFPYVWDEGLFQSNQGFNQNRASLGLSYSMSPDTRLDAGYILRSRNTTAGWDHDHILNVYLFFAPKVAAPYPEDAIPGGHGE